MLFPGSVVPLAMFQLDFSILVLAFAASPAGATSVMLSSLRISLTKIVLKIISTVFLTIKQLDFLPTQYYGTKFTICNKIRHRAVFCFFPLHIVEERLEAERWGE